MKYKAKRSIKEESRESHEENQGKDGKVLCLLQGLGKTDCISEAALWSAEVDWFLWAYVVFFQGKAPMTLIQ